MTHFSWSSGFEGQGVSRERWDPCPIHSIHENAVGIDAPLRRAHHILHLLRFPHHTVIQEIVTLPAAATLFFFELLLEVDMAVTTIPSSAMSKGQRFVMVAMEPWLATHSQIQEVVEDTLSSPAFSYVKENAVLTTINHSWAMRLMVYGRKRTS